MNGDNMPGSSEVSGDLNPGQWPILRPYVAASNEAGMPEMTAMYPSYLAWKIKNGQHWMLSEF